MAKKSELCQDAKGRFVRNLGWKQTPKGYGQQKFYLGRDHSKAKLASLKLEQLWQAVCRRWETQALTTSRPKPGQPLGQLVPVTDDPATGKPTLSISLGAIVSVGVPEMVEIREGRPVWDEVTLTIADTIRRGETVARVPLPEKLAAKGLADPSVGQWLNRLRDDVDVIHIELLDQELQAGADRELDEEAEQLVERARRLRRRHGGGETLHAAFDAHSKWIEKTYLGMDGRLDAWGSTQKRQVDFLRRHLPDCALVELTAHHIDNLLNMLRLRPIRENGQRVSASSAKNLIKQFRSFLRWLSKCPDYSWRRPPDYETTPLRVVRTPEEKSAMRRPTQVDVYSVDELKTLFEYAKPLQRAFMLIALNCGFGRAELASLRLDDVHLHIKHPHEREVDYSSGAEDSWVFRVRPKTGVYGEFKLWPVTVAAIEWWLRQRSQITVPPDISTLLVTRKGNRYDTPTKGNHTNFQLLCPLRNSCQFLGF